LKAVFSASGKEDRQRGAHHLRIDHRRPRAISATSYGKAMACYLETLDGLALELDLNNQSIAFSSV